MEEKIRYHFDKSSHVMYKYYNGTITLNDIFTSWDKAIANNLIPKETRGFILDYTNATFDINFLDSPKIAEYYKKHLNVFRNLKIAIITRTPKDVVIPTIVETMDDGYFSRPFYTLDAALQWVLR